jgi:type IV pilus assembly protein PilM
VLSGGGALLPGLPEVLAAQLDLAVEVADPIARLRRNPRGRHEGTEPVPAAATVAIGLTLGAA